MSFIVQLSVKLYVFMQKKPDYLLQRLRQAHTHSLSGILTDSVFAIAINTNKILLLNF